MSTSTIPIELNVSAITQSLLIIISLRIPIEFNPSKEADIKLYEQLSKYSNPAAYIKDVLRGLLPIPGQININIPNSKSNDEKIEDDEDLMDI